MSTQTNRAAMLLLARRARAYFAPVNRGSGAAAALDAAAVASFAVDAPPAPWTDLGWIRNLKRTAGTRIEAVRAGARGAALAQFRAALDARVEFDFAEWGKLQMALACGGEQQNALAGAAVTVLAGPTASELLLEGEHGFQNGDLIAVDVDYSGQTGYIGTGVAAAYVKTAVTGDPDLVRRMTLNVARVMNVTGTTVGLQQPLAGGAPATGARAQKVTAFMEREGGSFFQEWSALFVIESESGGRLAINYPRLQVAAPAQDAAFEIGESLEAMMLHASFIALPHADARDGEPVLCYRVWAPAAGSAVY
ncbi:MAG: hypothetical protein ACE14L_17435 [Terriglobales bacterium]